MLAEIFKNFLADEKDILKTRCYATDFNIYRDELDEDYSDSDTSSVYDDVLSNDLEKSHACCAAFTVLSLVLLYFSEFVFMCFYLVYSERHNHQGQIIAYNLCKRFPDWRFLENASTVDSWCDSRVFDKDFKLDLQCPCFRPLQMMMNSNITD